jgi:alpha-L-arabinofuranosidase
MSSTYNLGWWGMQVIPQTYNASTYILPAKTYSNFTSVTFSIRSNLTGETFVSQTVPVSNLSTFSWTQLSTQLENKATAPNSNNSFFVTFDAAEAAGRTFYFTFNSLFGETFKGRPNGIRKDLGEAVYGLKPKFLRFPGGNNIEGQSYATRWIWNETIGPLVDRKGRPGDWGYFNTNGFGFLEFLEWCEDMEMEPVMAIYAGYSLDGNSVPENYMDQVLQAALDQIEYAVGSTSTTWGARRAADGHPEPFAINFVELGNEDWFSATYPYRFPILYNGIKAAYPNITLISTAYNEAPSQGFNYTIDIPAGGMWDTHHYEEPNFFVSQWDFFDNWQKTTNNTDVGIMIGEYSVFQKDTVPPTVNYSDPADVHVFYPQLISATGEGVYLLAAERNPNVVSKA